MVQYLPQVSMPSVTGLQANSRPNNKSRIANLSPNFELQASGLAETLNPTLNSPQSGAAFRDPPEKQAAATILQARSQTP